METLLMRNKMMCYDVTEFDHRSYCHRGKVNFCKYEPQELMKGAESLFCSSTKALVSSLSGFSIHL